ncbi:MAG: DoxX family membrane protein [Ferruginibacter sp.]|nr:DoxX family membrane protein [Ferruginibacter sp.]
MLKKISLVLMIVLYIGAGLNHFIHPGGYFSIIPPYLPYPHFINIVSGAIEIILGILLIFPKTRKFGALGLVVLLVLFIPAHIYMIQKGGCMSETMCWPVWAAWVRLFPLQFLLMWWAWCHRK